MKSLEIEATTQTPKINFNPTTGVMLIEGKSYSDNVNETYQLLFDYIESNDCSDCPEIRIDFRWLYFNTATSKIIIKLIETLRQKTKFSVRWLCKEDFISMIEKGEEFKEILDIDLEVVYYE